MLFAAEKANQINGFPVCQKNYDFEIWNSLPLMPCMEMMKMIYSYFNEV
jgi:hypothetical protein